MGLAVAIFEFLAAMAPVGAKLLAGQITEEEARKESAAHIDAFAAKIAQSRTDDAKRDAATDAKLDAIDKEHGLLGDDGKPLT